MSRHVVGTLEGVIVVGFVLFHEVVEYLLQVRPHIRIGILVDGERTGGVLHEEVKQAHCGQWLGQVFHHLACYEVASSALGREGKFYLLHDISC